MVLDKLNVLLADYSILYMNIRGYHWNIEGNSFFTIHKKLEEMYVTIADDIDEIAEHMRMLGGKPMHAYSDYLKTASVKEKTNVKDESTILTHLISDFKFLEDTEKSIIKACDTIDETSTIDLMTKYIAQKEKLLWMLRATKASK